MWMLLMGTVAFGLESVSGAEQEQSQATPAPSFQVGVKPNVFLSFGGTSGLSVSSSNGGFVGGEASLSRIHGNRLVGLTGDVLWDTGFGGLTATVGPRIGALVFALDGGVSVRSNFELPPTVGSQVRALLNLGFGSMYYRVGFWPGAAELSTVHQLGVGIKFPQQLGYKPRTGEE